MASQRPIVVCDVDSVVVDCSREWFDYLRAIDKDTCADFEEVSKTYDFHKHFQKTITQDEAYYFWKQPHLYDKKMPISGSVEALYALKLCGFDIVFASHVEGNHAKSKYEFLKRNFEFDGFMATREKGYVRASIAIDDRLEHLASHPESVYTVLKKTPHAQTYQGDFKPDFVLESWDIENLNKLIFGWIHHANNDRVHGTGTGN